MGFFNRFRKNKVDTNAGWGEPGADGRAEQVENSQPEPTPWDDLKREPFAGGEFGPQVSSDEKVSWDQMNEVPFAGGFNDVEVIDMGVAGAERASVLVPELTRQQDKVVMAVMSGRESYGDVLGRPEANISDDERRDFLEAMANNKLDPNFEREVVGTIVDPVSRVGEAAVFTWSMQGDRHQRRILGAMTSRGFDNYEEASVADLREFKERYPLPMDFEQVSAEFLDDVRDHNSPEKYAEYQGAMNKFKRSVYGKQQEYYEAIKDLRVQAGLYKADMDHQDVASELAEQAGTPVDVAELEPGNPEMLEAFKTLFKVDLAVKQEMMDMAPSEADDFDEESRMGYVDKADKSLVGLRREFGKLEEGFGFGSIAQDTDEFFRERREGLALSRFDRGVVGQVYKKEFTEMRPKFVEDVKDKCVGYTMFGNANLSELVRESTSVNELLHAYHSSIMNNERILQQVPPIEAKMAMTGEEVVLRGEQTELGQQVFDAIPKDLDIGNTDIIAADDRVMMMVRDRGHALVINTEPITEAPEKMLVHYNIPKNCNIEMIKQLPGLDKITPNGTTGRFEVEKSQLGTSIADFISKVPTDSDMSKPGGLLYERWGSELA